MALDYLEDRAANFRLMQDIKTWWRKHGVIVHVWLEKANDPTNGTTIWVIRSNITQNVQHAGSRYCVG